MEKIALLEDSISNKISYYIRAVKESKSPYFLQVNIFNLKPTETLTILSSFNTYQQTTEYTCGPATALMVLNHFGETSYNELEIAKIMGCSTDLDSTGTSTEKMVKFFKSINWDVESSLTAVTLSDGYTFDDPIDFKDWVIYNLKNNTPIMVEWVDWGGHWQAIIGYDTMGTDSISDDVIIFADSYDTTDHFQDGYYVFSAQRFFYMWFDKDILPKEKSVQQWVIARPKIKSCG